MKNASYLARSGAIERGRSARTTQRTLAVAMALILAGLVALAACLAMSAKPSHAAGAGLATPTKQPAPAALNSPLVPALSPTPAAIFLGDATAAPRITATPSAWLYVPALARHYAAPIISNCPGVNLCNN